jgi:hyaluronan synthase
MLCKMQAVGYFLSFRVMQAAESLFQSVTFLSGPLSAYRRDILGDYLEDWIKQSFWGITATFRDDRSLTTMLLRRHKVIFNFRALTSTLVPDTYQTKLCSSSLREDARAASFGQPPSWKNWVSSGICVFPQNLPGPGGNFSSIRGTSGRFASIPTGTW